MLVVYRCIGGFLRRLGGHPMFFGGNHGHPICVQVVAVFFFFPFFFFCVCVCVCVCVFVTLFSTQWYLRFFGGAEGGGPSL